MKIIAQKEGEIVAQSDIHQEVFYIGRSRQNDLNLQSPKVSRRHAKIFFEDGQWFLEDLRSDNGTRYKGERVLKVNIRSGDKFYIGPFELELQATLPHKSADQVTVTSYIAPETVTSYQPPKSDNFLESIAVTPQPKLSSYVATHSKGRLEEALTSESIHTVIIDEESDKSPSLKTIEPNEDSVKTMIEDIPQLTNKAEKSHARLVRLDQGSHGLEINLNKSEFVLGNDEKSDIQILSDESPTRKATIRSTDSTFVIESTESESSTYVDGVPVKKRELENHDIIQVGKSRFEFLVGDSKSNVKTPKVIIRPVTSKASYYEEKLSDWRVLIFIGISLGLILILGLRLMSSGKTPVINVATPESDRIVLYHLTEAQKLIDEGKLDEAEIRVKIILGKVSPNNLDALKMLRKIQLKRDDKKDQQDVSDRLERKKESEVSKLLETHNTLVQQKKFSEAKKIQQKINQLDSVSDKTSTLANLEAMTEQAKRVELAEKKNKQELNKIYFQGVEEYEDGRLGQAESLLKEVAAKEGHTYQRSAKKLLATIESQLGGQIDQELKSIKARMRSSELLEAHKDLQQLAKKYPANKEIPKVLVETKKLMEDKARDIYRQGIATKEMAQDPAGAIDIFQKVLEYVPDPNHEYHKKAKSQINSLQLAP